MPPPRLSSRRAVPEQHPAGPVASRVLEAQRAVKRLEDDLIAAQDELEYVQGCVTRQAERAAELSRPNGSKVLLSVAEDGKARNEQRAEQLEARLWVLRSLLGAARALQRAEVQHAEEAHKMGLTR